MLKERDERETELNALLGRSVQSLWQEDLDAFLEEWEVSLRCATWDDTLRLTYLIYVVSLKAVLAEDERRLKDVSKKTKTGKTSLKKAAKAGAAARRVIKKDLGSDEEEEMDFNDDDSEDDFEPAKKVATKAKGSPRGKALQAKGLTPAIDQAKSGTKRSSAGLDDDDLEMLVASKPVNGTTSSSRPARSPPPAKKKAVAKPESIDMDNEDEDDYMIPSKTSSSKKAAESDTERLAPIFRKAPAAAAGAKARTASGSSASGAAKRARAAAKKAPAKTKKVVDSEDDGLDMAPAPVARKAKAGRKVSPMTPPST